MSAVEAVAEAIWVARHGTDWHSLRKLPRMNRELSIPPTLKQAQAAIAAYEAHLREQGKVIVDREMIARMASTLRMVIFEYPTPIDVDIERTQDLGALCTELSDMLAPPVEE